MPFTTFPNAEYLAENILSIPIFPSIKEDQQLFVAEKINDFFIKK